MKFERYTKQFRFLEEHRIDTAAELTMLRDAVQAEADALTDRRRTLYQRRRAGDDSVSGEITELTARLRELRRSMRLCGAIQEDIPKIRNMSSIGGREAHANDRSVTYEKAHKARPFNPLISHSGIPPGGGRQH